MRTVTLLRLVPHPAVCILPAPGGSWGELTYCKACGTQMCMQLRDAGELGDLKYCCNTMTFSQQ